MENISSKARDCRERRERYKAESRCIWCGEPAASNSVRCEACNIKHELSKKRSLQRRPEAVAEYDRRRRRKAMREGRCARCGKPLDPEIDSGRTECVWCLTRRRRYTNAHTRKSRT